MKKTMLVTAILVAASLFLSGCSFGSGSAKAPDGGLWKSVDSGRSWQQANDILSTKGKTLSLGLAAINDVSFDPQDNKTIYLSTESNGVYYSLDAGNSWQGFTQLPKASFNATLASPKNKCVIYAITANKLFKTENCGRDFSNIYFHQKEQVVLTDIAIDFYDPQVVYLGTSEGELLKSVDGGRAWLTSNRFGSSKIMDVIVDPSDSRIIYVGTQKNGIFKSTNAGSTWAEVATGIKSYSGSDEYRRLLPDPATPGGLMFISKFGIIRSQDRGGNWKSIELLASQKAANITAAGINPKNSNEFYYTTASSLVKTADGGATWSSNKLPYGKNTSFIAVAADGAAYLATNKITK